MIKKVVLLIFIAGLFIALQGCCYDDKEVDVLLSKKHPHTILINGKRLVLTMVSGWLLSDKKLLTATTLFILHPIAYMIALCFLQQISYKKLIT